MRQKITPFLWFNDQAEEAAKHYVSIFGNDSKITNVTPGPNGKAMSVSFVLEGQSFIALNGGPHYQFTPAISLFVDCATQEEVDALWAKLSTGGSDERCGWLKDRYGLSWQVIPSALGKLLSDRDQKKAGAAAQAMMKMQKIDLAEMQRAFDAA